MTQKVLIVDDDPMARALGEEILKAAGYAVETVPSAVGLSDRLRLDPPDVVLLDYRMADMDGLTALRILRGNGVLVPVVVLTATADQNTAVQFFRAGANDFLTKPFDPEYLLIVVRRTVAHHSRNLMDKIAAMSLYLAHKPNCEFEQGTCTCGMKEVKQDALRTVVQTMREGRAPYAGTLPA